MILWNPEFSKDFIKSIKSNRISLKLTVFHDIHRFHSISYNPTDFNKRFYYGFHLHISYWISYEFHLRQWGISLQWVVFIDFTWNPPEICWISWNLAAFMWKLHFATKWHLGLSPSICLSYITKDQSFKLITPNHQRCGWICYLPNSANGFTSLNTFNWNLLVIDYLTSACSTTSLQTSNRNLRYHFNLSVNSPIYLEQYKVEYWVAGITKTSLFILAAK